MCRLVRNGTGALVNCSFVLVCGVAQLDCLHRSHRTHLVSPPPPPNPKLLTLTPPLAVWLDDLGGFVRHYEVPWLIHSLSPMYVKLVSSLARGSRRYWHVLTLFCSVPCMASSGTPHTCLVHPSSIGDVLWLSTRVPCRGVCDRDCETAPTSTRRVRTLSPPLSRCPRSA